MGGPLGGHPACTQGPGSQQRQPLQPRPHHHKSVPPGDPAEISVWAADSDELVPATGRNPSCRRGGQGLSQPCPSGPEPPLSPACLRATWGRCAGADVRAGQVGRRHPSLPLPPSIPGSGLFPALSVCLPPAKAMSWKSFWGGDRKPLGGGQTKGGQIKARSLSEGWPGHQGPRTDTGPGGQQEGSPPIW